MTNKEIKPIVITPQTHKELFDLLWKIHCRAKEKQRLESVSDKKA